MKSKNYTKEDIKILLTVSATTFAIFVSLGSVIPIILSKGTELTANLWTNSLWLIGVGINWFVVLYPLVLFATKKMDKPNDTVTSISFVLLIISYVVIIIALVFFSQVVIKS